MSQVITFEDYTPVARYDELPWTQARIDEAESADGPWTTIDTIDIDPVDSDPANPSTRSFTTEEASDDDSLWYRIVFLDLSGDHAQETTPVQNVPVRSAYATVEELARILKIRTPSEAQIHAMHRVLLAAAGEIDSEIDRDEDDDIAGWQLALASEVNLARAVEHWQQEESPFGLIGIGSEFGATHTAKNSWERHAEKLAPLKGKWGVA